MNNEQFLLLKLAEEANEVAHMAMKCMQFGLEEKHPDELKNNFERLREELTGLRAIKVMLDQEEGITFSHSSRAIYKKIEKVKKYREYSKELSLCS